ncbi:MAG: DUF4956 domain-containing protein [Clostridia bacterium]|nr:DUF4956 domain-containing protein [Clostridia bacterium]
MEDFFDRLLAYIQVTSPSGAYALTVGTVLKLIGFSILLSAAVMGIYIFTHRKSLFRPSMVITILAIGPIVSIIVLGVGSNLARAISIGGGLALIRFRNTVGDPKDIIYMYLSVAAGLACGIGYWGFALIAIGMVLLILVIANLCKLDAGNSKNMKLRITVPETLNYAGVFDETISKFCSSSQLEKVSTADFGTLLELTYRIRIKDMGSQKAFIDEIREKNGNLQVALYQTYSME